jgi:DnaJ-class molecular chaperone
VKRFLEFIIGVKKTCQNCNGSGQKDGKTCPACNGAGGIDTTTI